MNSDHQRSSTYDLLAGHLGHLSEEQLKFFNAFKDNLAKSALYRPPTDAEHASHDEATLLRFLRARHFDPAKAQKQFADTEAWRMEHEVDRLYATFDSVEFERAKHFYPRWTGRRDKHGVPVYVYRLASLTGPMHKELTSVPTERRYQRIVALWEFMTRFTLPLCSALPHPGAPETPISAVTSIIDLADVSLGTMWSLRHHLQQASELATAHYPETLHTIAVVNAPSFFPTVWGWIKAWFDEGTRNKVHVLGKNPGPTLRGIIEPQDLPRAYGGELEWMFEDEPALDEPAKKLVDAVPKGPILFVDGQAVRPEVLPEWNVNGVNGIGGEEEQNKERGRASGESRN
ncbi:phosphatidylinositol transfer protein [Heterobasidion irregulare TC 32-1]|uniref:Phosphatidylinositol transfer protein n=1 Tax=Heterobasidion irregulare (strain TC 32-1) TaxID=747525 RepID=W4K9I2_HETIT|nr:phosphatidylinositol transfer protein [Heterobasidion irregulare TC 32-1]ETW82010.1 phosphatidylinositol transfer protein [Heterobasidion irregulare TC 32-1]